MPPTEGVAFILGLNAFLHWKSDKIAYTIAAVSNLIIAIAWIASYSWQYSLILLFLTAFSTYKALNEWL
jgi:hypothetical protein